MRNSFKEILILTRENRNQKQNGNFRIWKKNYENFIKIGESRHLERKFK